MSLFVENHSLRWYYTLSLDDSPLDQLYNMPDELINPLCFSLEDRAQNALCVQDPVRDLEPMLVFGNFGYDLANKMLSGTFNFLEVRNWCGETFANYKNQKMNRLVELERDIASFNVHYETLKEFMKQKFSIWYAHVVQSDFERILKVEEPLDARGANESVGELSIRFDHEEQYMFCKQVKHIYKSCLVLLIDQMYNGSDEIDAARRYFEIEYYRS
ncbi:unnamed protein product [Caenorhabditis sp. 36 PRJEB53466]|nr:unnamed protein product [Caenorhabditis sp. 36 PRJEB53466]